MVFTHIRIMIKAILFDFDGTLVDSAPAIVRTMADTFIHMGTAVPSDDAMRATIGLPLKTALQQLGQLSDDDAERAVSLYRELFPIYEAGFISIFPDVITTLSALRDKGIRMAICTSRETTSLDRIMERRGMSAFFETRVTGADGLAPKPAPDMVLALLERMGLTAEETIVVGDTTFDILMGNSAGCRTAAVTYGNHSLQQLLTASPTRTCARFAELPAIIDDL